MPLPRPGAPRARTTRLRTPRLRTPRLRTTAAPLAVTALTAALLTGITAGPAAAAADSAASAAVDRPTRGPLIFGHRGASGYRPEHTLASFDLAVRQGADVIEPDLVATKDRQLVVRHENDITGTTDVESRPEFADRRAVKVIDGVRYDGWFTEDFTLAELRTLRAEERLPAVRQENTIFDGLYQIPTLQEVIDLAVRQSRLTGRTIGIAPETKHPTYFDGIGLSMEEPLVRILRRNGLDRPNSGVYLQSFETANLRELHNRFRVRVDLVQLTSSGTTARPWDHVVAGDPRTYAQLTTPAGLRQIARYADVLGPEKTQILPRDAAGATGTATTLVADAHAAGLDVVPYTVRAENQFLPTQHRRGTDPNAYGNVLAEFRDLFAAGVDGVFTDNPDLGVVARADFLGYRGTVRHPEAPAA